MNKLLTLLFFFPLVLLSQTIDRQVIGSSGIDGANTTVIVSSTVGEVVVASGTTATVILSQGFQQSGAGAIGINDAKTGLSIIAQPNPTKGIVKLEMKILKPIDFTISVFDALGKQTSIPSRNVKLNGSSSVDIDFSLLASGNYYIHLINKDGSLNQSIKIQKIK